MDNMSDLRDSLLTYEKVHDKAEMTAMYVIYDIYARIFGLCRILGVTNLYDIGCAHYLQAYLLKSHKNMFYTGIDRMFDFSYVNELISTPNSPLFLGERIKFQMAEYPFDIQPADNNVAISSNCLGFLLRDEESIKSVAGALSRDFERIIMNVKSESFGVWETELAAFKLHRIGERDFLFGTKFPEDIYRLEEIGYNCLDNRFTIGFYDEDGRLYNNSNWFIAKDNIFTLK